MNSLKRSVPRDGHKQTNVLSAYVISACAMYASAFRPDEFREERNA